MSDAKPMTDERLKHLKHDALANLAGYTVNAVNALADEIVRLRAIVLLAMEWEKAVTRNEWCYKLAMEYKLPSVLANAESAQRILEKLTDQLRAACLDLEKT